MISAVRELAENRLDEQKEHLAVLKYLEACNLMFENGILSHTPIVCVSSAVLTNMEKGFKYFCDWKDTLSASGMLIYTHVA